jgi:hypothetical protein
LRDEPVGASAPDMSVVSFNLFFTILRHYYLGFGAYFLWMFFFEGNKTDYFWLISTKQ